MVSLTDRQRDDLFNALIIGMSPEDAFLYADLSADEIIWCQEDEGMQRLIKGQQKTLEYNLLSDMKRGAQHQISIGKTDATQWLLEKLYPRYSTKQAPDTGTINLVFNRENVEDIVSIVGDLNGNRAPETSDSNH